MGSKEPCKAPGGVGCPHLQPLISPPKVAQEQGDMNSYPRSKTRPRDKIVLHPGTTYNLMIEGVPYTE